jgi:hypothetical protein
MVGTMFSQTLMAGPLGVLSECPAAATTEVRQQPSPKLRKASMASPLGGAIGIPGSTHHFN